MTVCLMSVNVLYFCLQEIIFVLAMKENLKGDVTLESVL